MTYEFRNQRPKLNEARELTSRGLKYCPHCKFIKESKDFHKIVSRRAGLSSYCIVCHNTRQKEKRSNPVYTSKLNQTRRQAIDNNPGPTLIQQARHKAKKRGLEHTLTDDFIYVPEFCPILGIPLSRTAGKRGDNSPSLDRIDNTKGYIPGNVWVISWRANKLKSDASLEELERLVKCLRKKLRSCRTPKL